MLRDIKAPVYFKTNLTILYIFLAIIFVAVVVGLAVFFIKRARKVKAETPPAPKPAHRIALQALKELRMKDLPSQGKIKEYYIELSDIIRRYCENRFDIRAPEMTTDEFLSTLKESSSLSSAHKDLLGEFLNLCDIVKFAKFRPSRKEIDDSFGSAEKFVNETRFNEIAEC